MLRNIMILLRLYRVNQWYKNFIIFVPLLYSGTLFSTANFIDVLITFLIFCITSSTVYIFNDVFDIEKADYIPKPDIKTYKKLITTYNLDVEKSILFDDIPNNLIPAADLGLTTVQIYNKNLDKELNGTSKKIDYMTNNLKEWLQSWIMDN